MNAADLRLFHLVVKSDSFHNAAAIAGISAPALSKRISKLETDLGVQLIYRTTRRLTLTDAGKTLATYAKDIDQQVNEAVAATIESGEGMSGTINISVPTVSGELLLAEAIAEFGMLYPDITVNMRMENQFVDLVKAGIDLAIRSGVLKDSSLKAKHLIDSQWVACCSPKYLAAKGLATHPTQLSAHACLVYAHTHTHNNAQQYEWPFYHDKKTLKVNVESRFTSNNANALKNAALTGLGIVYVPKCCVYQELSNGSLVELFDGYLAKSVGVYAVYPFTRHMPLKIRRLIDHLYTAYQTKHSYFE